MAENNTPANPDLAELVADALSSMPPDKARAVAEHPDTPAALAALKQALGLSPNKQDVAGPQSQRAAKASGVATTAHPEYGESPDNNDADDIDTESRIRNQAISDMAVAAAVSKVKQPESSTMSQGMLDGLVDMAAHGMKSKLKELSTYATDLSAAVKDAQSNSKGK